MPTSRPLPKQPFDLLRKRRAVVAYTVYAAAAVVAYLLAYCIRFEFGLRPQYVPTVLHTLPVIVLLRLLAARAFRLSTARWRFVSTADVTRLAGATLLGTVLFFAWNDLLPSDPIVPRSVIVLEAVINSYLIAALWMGYRTSFERLRHLHSANGRSAKRVLIIGAGEGGALLAREMTRAPTGYIPVGFVDDDPLKWGSSVYGIEVLGSTTDLAAIAHASAAEQVVIAIPSASPAHIRSIVERCENAHVSFKVLPGVASVLAGNVQLNQLRDVRIEDLLGREPVVLELPELADDLLGRTVLITGAAGSIGSELSRQVALHAPDALILFDQAESDLFYLDRELRARHPELNIVPVVGDILDAGTVDRVFREYRPARVFHAAAYKHVPLMEANAREAIRNNVVGTWRIAEAAGQHGSERFVLVSTDKAVRPSNIMGASKRLAEIAVLHMQKRFPVTAYSAVRFGNVLGSQGSVLPIFKRQLAAGEPLTVTDAEMTRYFMTIPEAVQLILQASLLKEVRGHIALLDMGEPVSIKQLAENLLRLYGIPANGDRIVYTGIRPGEKLHEELIAPDEHTIPTDIPKIRLIAPHVDQKLNAERVVEMSERLLNEGQDATLLFMLRKLFPGLAIPGELQIPQVVASGD